MKKYLLLITLGLTLSINAQMLYKLHDTTATYTEMNGGTDVSFAAWDSSHKVILPFAFKYFDKPYNNVYITYNGVYFSDNGVDIVSYGSDEFVAEDLDPTLSPISFDIVGNVGDRIVKIQYKNVREMNSDTAFEYFLNNQIWIYENGNKIEFRFGPNSITDPLYNEFFIGLIDADNSPYYAIDSSAANPVLVRVISAGTFNGIPSYPVNGQVYTLSPSNSSSIDRISKPYAYVNNENGFTFSSENEAVIEVFDINGKLTATYNYDGSSERTAFDIDCSNGIYVVNIKMESQNFNEKLLLLQ